MTTTASPKKTAPSRWNLSNASARPRWWRSAWLCTLDLSQGDMRGPNRPKLEGIRAACHRARRRTRAQRSGAPGGCPPGAARSLVAGRFAGGLVCPRSLASDPVDQDIDFLLFTMALCGQQIGHLPDRGLIDAQHLGTVQQHGPGLKP